MSLKDTFLSHFPFEPTDGQSYLFEQFEQFLRSDAANKTAFLLRGYAGTGKTTVVSTLIHSLHTYKRKFALLAPTGRAAKVLALYSGFKAFTIHRFIYSPKDDGRGNLDFRLQKNSMTNTIFFVDEASMISDDGFPSLLSDLVEYVYSNEGNRLVLIGDVAQLPPVGKVKSPALDANSLRHHYRLNVLEVALTKVMRQQMESGILYNATRVRAWIMGKKVEPMLSLEGYPDIRQVDGTQLEDLLRDAYRANGAEDSIIITGANYRANNYNEYIRRNIFFREQELEAGDMLMVVKNNYLFLPEDSNAGFIANGDFIEVRKIKREVEEHGFRFADLLVQLVDYPELPPFDVRVILDSLHCSGPSLPSEDMKKLTDSVRLEYLDLPRKSDQKQSLKKDINLNALQVKFAYALTCHKSQGGQWKNIFLEPGFYKKGEAPDIEFLRWLYTGITRATENLYLLGFPDEFFESGEKGFPKSS